MISLSILDLAPVTVGSTPAQTFANTLALAPQPASTPRWPAPLSAHPIRFARVEAFVQSHRPDELLITANVFDHEARLRSFALAMQAWE